MGTERKDALINVVQHLPAAAQRPADKPAGTVVTSSGERVTLGEKPSHNTAILSTQQRMNTKKQG